VSAIWPPAGLGIAALYLWGLRLWPGVLIAELVINVELLVADNGLPLGSLIGQQTGNMAEIVVGAILLRRLIGRRARLDRVEQVGGMFFALVIATGISASIGTISMRAGGVIEPSEMLTFWRTWWLGDTSGGLVVLPLMLAWAPEPVAAWRRLGTWEGALMLAAVAALAAFGVSTDEPVTYLIFPVLVWASFRFGPPGATLSVALAAGIVIGVTAHEVGPFSNQPIDHKTLSTQLYIAVAALTTLFLSALVSERERSSRDLAEAKRREGERAVEERHRFARDLHDSVAQSLFSTALHTRSAQKALDEKAGDRAGSLRRDLSAIGDLTSGAQKEMRALIFQLGQEGPVDGLVAVLTEHASRLGTNNGLTIDVRGPEERLPLSPHAEAELFGIVREALANVVKHSDASTASVRVGSRADEVVVEIRDDGRGFDPAADHPGHYGLESMRGRSDEIDGRLTIESVPGQGTVITVTAPTSHDS
jgi:signal transduction histidine kinase